MGKKRNKNKAHADQVRSKRKGGESKVNPFEVKINPQKHNILGRKLTKFDQGMPGVSRSKAIKKRKETLLKEYQLQFKKNRFIDKRFGENDTDLSLEEKMMKRYALERSKATSQDKFNLNEDEELTHFGQSLAEIEKFDVPVHSDDDDDDDKRAAAKIVAEQHFGGFMVRKKPEDEKKSWKERMEDVIKESKKKKHEKQVENEQALKMTEELDLQWKQLQSFVSKGKAKDADEGNADDYDMAVKSLQFEMKGQATDRLKTEEELAREEKERLEKLEADRIRRMKGLTEEDSTPKSTHKSADDLDDGFYLETHDFDYVSYKDGEMNQEDSSSKSKDDGDDDDDDDDDYDEDDDDGDDVEVTDDVGLIDGDDDYNSNDDVGDDDEDDNEDNEDDDDDDNGDGDDDDVKSEDEVEGQIEDSENDSDDEEDNFSDIESDNDNEDDNTVETKKSDVAMVTKRQDKKILKTDEEKKAIIDKAKKEIPYTFKAPETYEELLEILEDHDLNDQLTIIDRIRKCHHPSLAEGNKQKLETLFGHLVQLYCDLFIQDTPQFDYIDRLLTPLYELAQMSPENAATAVTNNLMDRHEEFKEICQNKNGRGLFPGLDTMMLFKLISILFPTSDFRHPVTTPSLLFICEILSCSPVTHSTDIVAGLFLCNLCLEYVSTSKRFIPEVINFLHGLLFLAIDKDNKKLESVRPPFKPVGKHINLLHVSTPVKSDKMKSTFSLSEILSINVDDSVFNNNEFRVTAIGVCIKLLIEFSKLYSDDITYKEIFSPVVYMCEKLPVKKYPDHLQQSIQELTSYCKEACKKERYALVIQKKKPKPLRTFEPIFEDKFDGRKKRQGGSKDFVEKQKLMHKYKKEMKGAIRELRKDTRFLARQHLKETMDKDYERKRKVNEIMGTLANQEGEYKKMKLGKMPDS